MNPPKYWFLILSLLIFGCARNPTAPATSIYDDNADAHHDIAAAISNAGKSQRNVVLIFGANW